jgi:hypothetical protein
MKHRTPRLLGAIALAISLSVGTLVGSTIAANPGWNASVVASPGTVSSGDTVGFVVTFTNGGSSNISQLYVNMPTPTGAAFTEVLKPASVACTPPAGSTPLMCSYGAVNAGTTVVLTVVYTSPATTGLLSATANFNTTGATGSDRGGNSHGDTLSKTGSVTLSTSRDFAGRFVDTEGQTTVFNDPTLGNKNKQSTSATINVTKVPVTVEDGFAPSCIAGSTICPTTSFGQASELFIANGQSFGAPFKVVINLYHPGVSASEVHGVYHSFTNALGVQQDENITAPCTGDPSAIQCFTATDIGNQNVRIIIWLLHNGKINGW